MRIDGARGTLTARLLRQDQHALLLLEEAPLHNRPLKLSHFGLSRRETEILGWVVQGKTNPEVAMILGISARTVQKHLEHIYGRLGVENRHAAISLALTASRMARTSEGLD
ncbi:MAG: helix-turn-helix transcriptional regulator [Nitrospira sp.]|nr:helix-turn-helix transcriptional regulator [Nitrospira sp.]